MSRCSFGSISLAETGGWEGRRGQLERIDASKQLLTTESAEKVLGIHQKTGYRKSCNQLREIGTQFTSIHPHYTADRLVENGGLDLLVSSVLLVVLEIYS